MTEESASASTGKSNFELLYGSIYSQLNEALKSSRVPDAPALMKRAEGMLDEIEPLYICPEIVGKACLLVSSHLTNELFGKNVFGPFFSNRPFVTHLSRLWTQIPFVIVHGEAETITAVNYANIRVPLSEKEYDHLIYGSGSQHIALNKIVQMFIVTVPLKHPEYCIIFDNIYQTADRAFSRVIDKRIAYVNEKGLETFKKQNFSKYNAITGKSTVESKIRQSAAFTGYPFVGLGQLEAYLMESVQPVMYGFYDEFKLLETQIRRHYLSMIQRCVDTAKNITGDIVRQSGADVDIQTRIRSAERARESSLRSELKEIEDVLSEAEEYMKQVQDELKDTAGTGKKIPGYVLDMVFERLFCGIEADRGIGKAVLSRLTSLGYADCDLVSAYLLAADGKTVSNIQYQTSPSLPWEKAKMYLAIAPLDAVPLELIQRCIRSIGVKRLTTGKEYYAKYLAAPKDQKTACLRKSFDRGYEPAGLALFEEYKKGNRGVNLFSLANALIPEACMEVADQRYQSFEQNHEKRFYNLTDYGFAYYKIAASKEHLDAVGKIVDIVYQSRFANAFQLYGDKLNDKKFADMITNGRAVCQLCYYLIDKKHNVRKYREILGVVLFCLNENLPEAMHQLSGIDTGVANYCKGKMYEYGNGTVKNLDQSYSHYKKAEKAAFNSAYVQKCISRCEQKIEKRRQEEEAERYHPDTDYTPQYSGYSRSSDWSCFITTAACMALQDTDDCAELELLRHFRDSHIQNTPEGELVVAEYYRVGPRIVSCIENLPDPSARYLLLWEKYIAPSCQLIKAKQWESAKRFYIHMVRELCEEFGINVKPSICEILKYY